jgi:hypothetical protein
MIFTTRSGSVYDVDTDTKQIRRLSGLHAPQARQGKDGEWRPYEAISKIEVGYHVCIAWPEGTPLHEGSPPWATPSTITSVVTGCYQNLEAT